MNIKGFDLLNTLYTENNVLAFAFKMNALLLRIKNHAKTVHHYRIRSFEHSIDSCSHAFIRHDLAKKYSNEAKYRILDYHFEYDLQKHDGSLKNSYTPFLFII
jgi:hypothetical protein